MSSHAGTSTMRPGSRVSLRDWPPPRFFRRLLLQRACWLELQATLWTTWCRFLVAEAALWLPQWRLVAEE